MTDIQSGTISDEATRKAVDLDDTGLASLARRLSFLPEKEKGAVCGIFYFHLSAEDVTVFYGIDHPEEVALYYRDRLGKMLGLGDQKIISKKSMYEACERMLLEDSNDNNTSDEKKTSTQTPGKKKTSVFRIVLSAAAALFFFLIVGISASARFRSFMIRWLITSHNEYSEIKPLSDGQAVTIEGTSQYYPAYIPNGFRFVDSESLSSMMHYVYTDRQGYYLNIEISIPDHATNLNTENAIIENTIFHDEKAFFILHDDGINFFVCVIDGYPVYIYGRVTQEELLKIAEGITKRE